MGPSGSKAGDTTGVPATGLCGSIVCSSRCTSGQCSWFAVEASGMIRGNKHIPPLLNVCTVFAYGQSDSCG